jgi:hypothetical protein
VFHFRAKKELYKNIWYQLGYSTENDVNCELLYTLSLLSSLNGTAKSRYSEEQLKGNLKKLYHYQLIINLMKI